MTSRSKTEKTRHERGRKRYHAPHGYRPYPVPWQRYCGFCGRTGQVHTNGRMLVCGYCGH